jgi:hypothetical protein
MSKLSFGAYACEKVRCLTIPIRRNEEKNSVLNQFITLRRICNILQSSARTLI